MIYYRHDKREISHYFQSYFSDRVVLLCFPKITSSKNNDIQISSCEFILVYNAYAQDIVCLILYKVALSGFLAIIILKKFPYKLIIFKSYRLSPIYSSRTGLFFKLKVNKNNFCLGTQKNKVNAYRRTVKHVMKREPFGFVPNYTTNFRKINPKVYTCLSLICRKVNFDYL